MKLNPLADWTLDEVWDYVREHDVPYHELFDHGYASIGCAPCTRAVLPGESERAGRWWWEQETDKECGIHCSVGLLGSASDSERAAARRTRVTPRARGGGGMSFGYPVMLELEGRRAVVIGARRCASASPRACSPAARTTCWSWRRALDERSTASRACGSSGGRGGPVTSTERPSPSRRRTTPPCAPRSRGRHEREEYSSM